MENYISIFGMVLFILVIVAVIYYIVINPLVKQNRDLNGIVNYDAFMRRFVFQITLTKEECFQALKIPNACDVLEYSVSEEQSSITFIKYGSHVSYALEITPCEGYSILICKQITPIAAASVLYKVNSFWIKKINAVPLSHSSYR